MQCYSFWRAKNFARTGRDSRVPRACVVYTRDKYNIYICIYTGTHNILHVIYYVRNVLKSAHPAEEGGRGGGGQPLEPTKVDCNEPVENRKRICGKNKNII